MGNEAELEALPIIEAEVQSNESDERIYAQARRNIGKVGH